MQHRVGALHVRYRVRDGSAEALTPSIQRALSAGLADALEARLESAFGQDPSVIVVRELQGHVVLAGNDSLLDRRVIDRVCASSFDAFTDSLARPDSDSLMRFADEAEFVGSFIVDLLADTAWGHWYYGAFLRHRRPTTGDTLRALLADCRQLPRVFAWLSSRGKLGALFTMLGARELLELANAAAGTESRSSASEGVELLAGAARDIAAALGIETGLPSPVELAHRFRSSHPAAPPWIDRRALNECVLEMLRECLRDIRVRVAKGWDEAATSLSLAGKLDWLDVAWILAQLRIALEVRNGDEDVPAGRHGSAGSRENLILERLLTRVRAGELHFDTSASADERVVQLLAWLAEELPGDAVVDETMLVTLRAVAARLEAQVLPVARDLEGSIAIEDATSPTLITGCTDLTPQSLANSSVANHPDEVAIPRPRGSRIAVDDEEEFHAPTDAGGLYLLTRALLDLRVPASAAQHGVPLPPLLAALARQWFEVAIPFDEATALWTGIERPDFIAIEDALDSLSALNDSLAATLVMRGSCDETSLQASIDADRASLPALPCAPSVSAEISRTGCLLLRAWSCWLRGIGGSSAPFLLKQCLRRQARARIDDGSVSLQLGPAPLDTVLRMAGYFQRIESVPWLAARTITFDLVPELRTDA